MLTEQHARDYLLGRLGETDTEALESLLLEDDDLFLTMRSAEDDLFDDFARGALTDAERHAFLERYRDPGRVRFARALAAKTAESNVVPISRRHWLGWAAAAAVLIAIVATLTRTPQRSVPVANAVRPAARIAAVTIALGGTRSPADVNTIDVPRDASVLRLRIRINPQDRFDSYSVELRSRGTSWHAEQLHATSEHGDLFVTADVPASRVADGPYELAVRGGAEDLGFLPLEVRRTK